MPISKALRKLTRIELTMAVIEASISTKNYIISQLFLINDILRREKGKD